MDPFPRVSIIIPTFNRPNYLRQAIESVLAQTYPDFEIVVVDDGSTDDTAAVVGSLADPRIVYIRQENTGRSAARNRGMQEARGEFIALLDDDDLYLPHKLVNQAAYLDAHPEVDLVAGGAQMIDADGRWLRDRRCWEEAPFLTVPACLYACSLLTCSVLFRGSMLSALDHWFDPALTRAEDTDFWLRSLLAGCRMAWLPEIVAAYRRHAADSQQDGTGYSRSYRQVLDKLFTRSDLPPEVLAQKEDLYAHYLAVGACHAYAVGQFEAGLAGLSRAVNIKPDLVTGSPSRLAATIAEFAQSDLVSVPHAYIDQVFDHLPPDLSAFRHQRGEAHGVYHMRRVFAANETGTRPAWRDWLESLRHHPGWLRNRWVWSILVRNLLGVSRRQI